MRKSKATPHVQTLASRSKKSAVGGKHESVHDASTPSAGKAAEETAYQPLFANIAKVMCQGGAAYWQLALAFQVDEDTIRDWIRTYKDFAAGCKYGMNFADDAVERSLYQLAMGYDYQDVKIFRYKGQVIYAPYTKHVPASVEACVFWLINRRPKQWNADSMATPDADDDDALMRLYEWATSPERVSVERQAPHAEGVRRPVTKDEENDENDK